MKPTNEQIKAMTGKELADLLRCGGTSIDTVGDALRRAIHLLDTGYWPQPMSKEVEAAMYRAQKNGDVVLRHLGGHVTFLNSGAVMIDRTADPEPYTDFERRTRATAMKQHANTLHAKVLDMQPGKPHGTHERNGWNMGFHAAQTQFIHMLREVLK